MPLVLRVDYPGLGQDARDATENLSATGLFIRTERSLQVGQRVPMVISFPGLLDPVEMEVEVARIRTSAAEGPPGVAVKAVAAEDQTKLAQLAQTLRTAAAQAHDTAPRRNYRVLVVEDSAQVLEMYEYALRKLRAQKGGLRIAVEYAANGLEALQRLGTEPRPDLVISALFMPVMDGFALIREMRSDPALAGIPLLVISAGGGETRTRAIEAGVDVYLQKPVQFSDVVGTVRMLLNVKG